MATTAAPRITGRAPPRVPRRKTVGWKWVLLLLMSICFEGLGRKFLPFVPATAFYFLKDAVLLGGYLKFGVPREVKRAARSLYGGFEPVFIAAMFFTVLQCFNPEHGSLPLAVLGLRAYWLWYLAPLVLASAMKDGEDARKGIMVLAGIALVVTAFAAYQFSRPATSSVNTYALYEGKEMNTVAIVDSTGRARVSSTFSYLSGFADFTVVVPMMLLALALDQQTKRGRTWMFAAVVACAATIPMSGSRGAVMTAAVGLAAVAYAAGFLMTRVGRRMIVGSVVVACAMFFASPEAIKGVSDRFTSNRDETSKRIDEAATVLPFVAMAVYPYPVMGIGTGKEQNAAYALGLNRGTYGAENESHKVLVEQGVIGMLLIWLARFGISVGLFRASRRLRKAGRGGMAGMALGLAIMNLLLRQHFDHVAQALFFVGVGYVLHGFMQLPVVMPVRVGLRPRGAHGPVPIHRVPARIPIIHTPPVPLPIHPVPAAAVLVETPAPVQPVESTPTPAPAPPRPPGENVAVVEK